jgi:hypothetical protein
MPIFLDIETLDFFTDPAIKALPRAQQLQAIRYGLAVTIDTRYQNIRGYDEATAWPQTDTTELWRFLLGADLVVGWNILAFDYPIIRHAAWGIHDPGLTLPNTLDLFDRIRQHTGRWYSLGYIAERNQLGGKSADGQQAAEWLRAGEWHKAARYCKQDVLLTKGLYEMAKDEGLLLHPRSDRKYPEVETLRIWIDGDRWRLRNEDTGVDFREAWDV